MKFKVINSILLLFFLAGALCAQVSEKEKAQQELERQQEIERRIVELLDELAASAWSLKLPENRAFILSSTAELFWTRNEKKARSLFWDAVNTLNLVARAPDSGSKTSTREKQKVSREYYAVYQLRMRLLRKVAHKDPQFALELLRATRQPDLEPNSDPNLRLPDDHMLEDQIAAEAVARDPQRALQIARDNLSRGLSYELINVLLNLNQEDTALATQFAGEIIDKVRTQNFVRNSFAPHIAYQLLIQSRVPEEPLEAVNPDRPGWKVLKIGDERKREIIQLLTDAALTSAPNPAVLYSLLNLMPELEKFAPDRVAQIQQKLTDFNQTLSKEEQRSVRFNTLALQGDALGMIHLANTIEDNKRDIMFRQAATIGVIKGTTNALRDTVNKLIKDDSERKVIHDYIDSEEIGFAAYYGRVEDLQKALPRIRLKEERARAMAEIAFSLEKSGKHDEALKLVQDARSLVKVDLTSETQSTALLTLVLAYALIDPPQAFAIIESAIDRANDQVAKLALVDKLIETGFIKKGELRLDQQTMFSSEFMMFKYGKGLSALAKIDFNRTRASADRFQRNELRLLGRLLIAQSLSLQNRPITATSK